MNLEQQLEQDIKAAQLAGDTFKLTTLRGIKATLLNVKVATGKRDSGLTDEEVLPRCKADARLQHSDMYKQGDATERAEAELAEKAIIDAYLPAQLGEAEIADMINEVIAATGAQSPADMGKVIGQVKAKAGAAADGAVIARLAKEKLA